jgi:carboxylesterase type B
MPGTDENFWIDQDPLLPLEQGPFSSWAKVVVVGMTKDEFASYAEYWQTLTAEELVQNLRGLFSDQNFAQEVLEAYCINDSSEKTAIVEAYIQYTSDCFFGRAAYEIASKHDSHPVCLYKFDDTDPTESILKDKSYHSMNNAFLFHLSPVAGPMASPSWRATADAYSEACINLAYGEQPWEPYLVEKRAMSFNGEMRGLTKDLTFSRWIHLISSQERAEIFDRGKILLFKAANYCTMLGRESDCTKRF